MTRKDILITRDSKGKIRVVDISVEWNETLHGYVIDRKTCQYKGKVTQQPIILIERGKVKRTVTEQATLEYNSHIKKYLDKGYKNIEEFGYSSLDEFDPNEVFPQEVTDQNGAKKIMRAKSSDDVAISNLEKRKWASRKLDGVRNTTRLEEDNSQITFKTASRGGGNYDIPATHILEEMIINNDLCDWFLNHPGIVLDGELYIHGKPLPYISGLCRKITLEEEHKELKYYIYDLMYGELPFEERLKLLYELAEIMEDSERIVVCEHIETNSWTDIKKLHDKWVEEGYEGCVVRDPDKEYGYGKKDNRMIKVKEFTDDEFEILGMDEGLREEDFTFLMKSKNGKTFNAKPMGNRALRQEYRDSIQSLIGKLGTVKFFGYTEEGIPNLPHFKYVRYGDDND